MADFERLNELMGRVKTQPDAQTGNIILWYGPPKTGKTTMACQAPQSVLVQCKDYSAEPLKRFGGLRPDLAVIDATGWRDALDVLDMLAESKKFKFVIVDGISGLAEWCDEYATKVFCNDDIANFLSYGRGNKSSAIAWKELMEVLNKLKANGIWVFLLSHKATVTEKSADHDDYLKNRPAISEGQYAGLMRYMDQVCFIDFLVAQKTQKKDGMGGPVKVVGGEKRVMYTSPAASYEAGGRLMPGVSMIEMGDSPQEGFSNFMTAIKNSMVATKGAN